MGIPTQSSFSSLIRSDGQILLMQVLLGHVLLRQVLLLDSCRRTTSDSPIFRVNAGERFANRLDKRAELMALPHSRVFLSTSTSKAKVSPKPSSRYLPAFGFFGVASGPATDSGFVHLSFRC